MTTNASRRGVFVVFEGPEGAGKSTQIARLAQRMRNVGRDPLLAREPGGTLAGDAIRAVLLDPQQQISPLAEFLLYSASRAQLVEQKLSPALLAGRDVVCDRFTGASVAYQGHGRGLDLELIDDVNRRVTKGLRPDLTVLLDIDPVVGLARAAGRSSQDRLESAGLEFHRRVREGFLAQAREAQGGQGVSAQGVGAQGVGAQGKSQGESREGNAWLVIDGGATQDEVAEKVWNGVNRLLTERSAAAVEAATNDA